MFTFQTLNDLSHHELQIYAYYHINAKRQYRFKKLTYYFVHNPHLILSDGHKLSII